MPPLQKCRDLFDERRRGRSQTGPRAFARDARIQDVTLIRLAALGTFPLRGGRLAGGRKGRPYGWKRTGRVGSANPGAGMEPYQRQFLQTQGPVARMEPQKTAQILRAGNFAPPRRYASPVMGVLGGGRHGGREALPNLPIAPAP